MDPGPVATAAVEPAMSPHEARAACTHLLETIAGLLHVTTTAAGAAGDAGSRHAPTLSAAAPGEALPAIDVPAIMAAVAGGVDEGRIVAALQCVDRH